MNAIWRFLYFNIYEILIFTGFCLVVAGLWMVYVPIAVIVAGLLVIGVSFLGFEERA